MFITIDDSHSGQIWVESPLRFFGFGELGFRLRFWVVPIIVSSVVEHGNYLVNS